MDCSLNMIDEPENQWSENYFSDSRQIGTNLPPSIILKGGAGNQEKSILSLWRVKEQLVLRRRKWDDGWNHKGFKTL
jgi:hypothetical protein